MSFHVEDRFTPGPVSKVPVSWFNNVGHFLNNLVGSMGVKVCRDMEPPQIMLDAETAKDAMFMAMGQVGEAEDVVDMKDSPSTIQGDGATETWTAGGEHGLYLDCYCKVAPQTASSNYTVLQRARLTISSDGLVVKAELLGERTRIQAKNA